MFSVSACAGEYVLVSALVHALQAVSNLTVTSSSLVSSAGIVIPASSVDVKVLKSWFQGNPSSVAATAQKYLVPELLLKDDNLVKVDIGSQTNYLRSTGVDGSETYLICSNPDSSNLSGVRPRDAKSLQPVDLVAGDIREFWITIHVADTAPPGAFSGSLLFSSSQGAITLPIHLIVRPFVLLPPRLIYSLYYRGTLTADGAPTISSEGKSEEQYRAEMEDLKAHGVPFPTNYQGHDERILRRMLQIRREVGLPTDRSFNLGYGLGPQVTSDIPALQGEVKWWLQFLKPFGYTSIYFYGKDEASGPALRLELPFWQACRKSRRQDFCSLLCRSIRDSRQRA